MAELLMDLKDKMAGSAKSGAEAARLKAEELRERTGQTKEQAPAFEGSTTDNTGTTTTTTSSSSSGGSLMEKAQAMKNMVTEKLQRSKEETTGESAAGETPTESAQIAASDVTADKAEKTHEKREQAKAKASEAAARAKQEMLPVKDVAVEKLRPEKEQLKSDLTEEQQRAKAAADARLAAAQETARAKAEAAQRSLAETTSTTKGRAEEVAGVFAADAGGVARTAAEAARAVLGGAHKTLVQASRTNVDYPADNGIQDGSAGRELSQTGAATVNMYGTTREQAGAALTIAQTRADEMIDVGRDGVVEIEVKADSAIDPTRDETKAKIESEKEVVHGEASRLTEKTRGIAHRQADVAADTTTAVTAKAHEQTIKNADKAKERDISGDVASTIEQGKAKATDKIEQSKQKASQTASEAQGAAAGTGSSSTTGTSGTSTSTRLGSTSGIPDLVPTSRATEDTGLQTMQGQDVHFETLPPPSEGDLAYERMNPSLFGPQGASSSSNNATGTGTSARGLDAIGGGSIGSGISGSRTGDAVVPTSGVRDETQRTADGTPADLLTGANASNLTSGFKEERNTSTNTGGAYSGTNNFTIGEAGAGTNTSRDASSLPSSGNAFDVSGTESSFPGTGGGSSSGTGTSTSFLNTTERERPPLERQGSGAISGIGAGGSSSSGSFGAGGRADSRDVGITSGTTSSGKTQDEQTAEETAETAKKGAMSAAAALKMAAQAGLDEYKKSDGASVDTTAAGAEAMTHGTAAAQALKAGGGDAEPEVHSKVTDAGRALGAAAKGAVADYKGEGDSEGGTAALKARAQEASARAQEEAEKNMTPEQKEAAARTREVALQKKKEAEETARAAKARAEELQREAKEAADLAAKESKAGATGVKDVLVSAHKAQTDEKATQQILKGAESGVEPMRAATEKLSSVAIALKESLDTAMGKTKYVVVEGANTADDARHGRGEAGKIAGTAKETAAAANAKAQQMKGSASSGTSSASDNAASTARGGADKAKGAVSNVDSDKYGAQAEDKKNLAADKTKQGADLARSKVEEFTPQGQAKAHTAIDKTADTAEPRAHQAIDSATEQLHRGVDLAAEQAHTGTHIAQEQTNAAADAAKAAIDAQSDSVRRAAAEREAAVKKQAELASKTAAVFFGAKKV